MPIDAAEFDQIAREVFAPIYPVIAQQIMDKTGITSGKCLDVGCGGGYLGLALAQSTDLSVGLFDQSPDMLRIAQQNIVEAGLEPRVQIMEGDVHAIPIRNQRINLVVSRGSIFFWENLSLALREIYRVLAPGGMAYIGGGFGNLELKNQIDAQMTAQDPEWPKRAQHRMSRNNAPRYLEILRQLGISDFELTQGDGGLWIIIRR